MCYVEVFGVCDDVFYSLFCCSVVLMGGVIAAIQLFLAKRVWDINLILKYFFI